MGLIFCRSARETAESMQSEMSGGQSPASDHAYHTHPPTCIVIHGREVKGEYMMAPTISVEPLQS